MINYLFWGTVLLFVSSAIFYAVWFYFLSYWHEKKTTFVIVPLLFTFDFFLVAFLIITLAVMLLQYLPTIMSFVNT